MAKLHVILLVHESLIPPDDLTTLSPADAEACRTEFDVYHCLNQDLNHNVTVVGIHDQLAPLQQALDPADKAQPDIVFNLMEEFAGNPAFDYYIASYLEMRGIAYTGCNPNGLLLARNKAKANIILAHHGIATPAFIQYPLHTQPQMHHPQASYPMIVKPLTLEGSVTIARASIVKNDQQLAQRVKHVHDVTQSDAIAEQFIAGREIYVTITGNTRLSSYPFRELIFNNNAPTHHNIATQQVKWSEKYRQRHGITYQACQPLPAGIEKHIIKTCKQAYKILVLNGYARFDLRLSPDNTLYMLEANPNPGIARNEETIASASAAGLSYPEFIQSILTLGLNAHKNRHFPVPRQ